MSSKLTYFEQYCKYNIFHYCTGLTKLPLNKLFNFQDIWYDVRFVKHDSEGVIYGFKLVASMQHRLAREKTLQKVENKLNWTMKDNSITHKQSYGNIQQTQPNFNLFCHQHVHICIMLLGFIQHNLSETVNETFKVLHNPQH